MKRTTNLLLVSLLATFLIGICTLGMQVPATNGNGATAGIGTSGRTLLDYPGRIEHISRTIKIDSYGGFTTTDEITFINDRGIPIQEFLVCGNTSDHPYRITATGKGGQSYSVEKLEDSFNGLEGWKVIFDDLLLPQEKITFTIKRFFAGELDIDASGSTTRVHFVHGIFTSTAYFTDKITTTVDLPADAQDIEFVPDYGESQGTTDYLFSSQNLAPFDSDVLEFNFTTSSTQFVVTEKSVKKIHVSTVHDWLVEDTVTVKNLGKRDVNSLVFVVPVNASGFTARDYIGEIQGVSEGYIETGAKTKEVTVSLLTNRYAITTGNKLQLTFSFWLPTKGKISVGDEKSVITVDIYSISQNPWVTLDTEIWVGLPDATGVNVESLSSLPDAVENLEGTQYLVYKPEALSPGYSQVVVVEYTYTSFAGQARALFIALVAALVTIGLIVARKAMARMTPGPVARTEEFPVDALKEFTSIFVEKISLYLELEKANEDYKRRRIKKREYTILVNDINKRLKKLDDEVARSKKKLIDYGGRLREIIDELDVLEAERQAVQDSLVQLEQRYKGGKIRSRVAYEKIYSKYEMRLKKIQVNLDQGINELKSYFA